MKILSSMHALKMAAAVATALALGACARIRRILTNSIAADRVGAGLGRAGAATPGSTQDFVVNVGDRVFFDSNSSEINGAGQATLDKQARWLNQYGNYAFTIEGHADERGTREYILRWELGARRRRRIT